MKVYRFLPPKREDVLFGQGKIWFTPPSYFNDPFELSPVVKEISDKPYLRRFARENMKPVVDMDPPPGFQSLPRRKRRELHRSLGRKFVDDWRAGLGKAHAEDMQHAMPKLISTQFGALCFSTLRDNLLMWSHYTECHKGFALEFDSENPNFHSLGPLRKIEYGPERPVYDPVQNCDYRIYLRKSPDWQYENEYRIFRNADLCSNIELRENGHRFTLWTAPLPWEALTGVWFGVRSSPEFVAKVKRLVPRSETRFYKARLDRTLFSLNWDEC